MEAAMVRTSLSKVGAVLNQWRIMSLAAILAAFLVFGAVWLALGQRSYEPPGPVIAAIGLAVAVLLVGLALQAIHARNGELSEQAAQLRRELDTKNSELSSLAAQLSNHPEMSKHLPRIIGLELLVNRWQHNKQELSVKDSEALFQQIRLALSIARLDCGKYDELRFLKAFSGTKVERGVFLIQRGQGIPLVLKFDTVKNINKEIDHYNEYVANEISFTPAEPKRCHGEGMIGDDPWSAIIINPIGADELRHVQTFGDYYQTHNSQAIQNVLQEHIFIMLNRWWGISEQPRKSLYDEYKRLQRTYDKENRERALPKLGDALRIEALNNFITSEPWFLLGDTLRLRNPLNWVEKVFHAQRLGKWAINHHLRHDSIVHGDFHAGNILVTEKDKSVAAWLIDFPHMHTGPTVQDIARLEADIKFWLMPRTSDYNLLYEWESALLPPSNTPEPGAEALRPKSAPSDPELQKGWQAIDLLRKQARHYIRDEARNYYLALLHATLPILYYRDRSPEQKLYALISAALLCERLEY
jgi:hypothetical protein